MTGFRTLDDLDANGKAILVRPDINSPLDPTTLEISDRTRIERAAPTVQELLEKGAKVIILAHQGRRGSWDYIGMERHAKVFSEVLGQEVRTVETVFDATARDAVASLRPGEVLMLGNVRQWDGEDRKVSAEEHAVSDLVRSLAPLLDAYVNDAFAAAHRSHCSLVGFTMVLPSYAGRLLESEVRTLSQTFSNPRKPAYFLFGGAKFADAIVIFKRLLEGRVADRILLAGMVGNAFLHAQGVPVGATTLAHLDEESDGDYTEVEALLREYGDALVLPLDVAVEVGGERVDLDLGSLPADGPILDLGPKTIRYYSDEIGRAATVFISGPCGMYEKEEFGLGTKEVFGAVAGSKAYSIAGGGHTVSAINHYGLAGRISYISTGGGALERFMLGKPLPVIEALERAAERMAGS